jgi:signal transduction histidine kinase
MDLTELNNTYELLLEKYNRHEKILIQAYLSLKQKEEILRNLNNELSVKDEELLNANEELKSANESLFEKNSELKSALKRLQEAQSHLIQSEKMASLGVLTSGVAHELNNPLNFISSGVLFLETYFKENIPEKYEEVKRVIEGINAGVQRSSAIVHSLNQYNRSHSFPVSKCNLHDIIDDCLVILHTQYNNRIDVQKYYCEKQYSFEGNEGKLHQAFLNIIANSIQSIEDKGTLTILTSIVKEEVHIAIEDTGIGISEANLKKIFDPFFTTKETGKGIGLGLTITFNIIKEHNGIIQYESRTGVGTKVLVVLPLNTN